MPNLLQILFLEYPDARWILCDLYENPNINKSMKFLNDNKKWVSKLCRIPPEPISYGATAKWEDIYNEFDSIQLDRFDISKNPNVTWEMVKSNPNIDWYYSLLSSNINVTAKIVADNPDIQWDIVRMFRNPNMTWKHLKNNYKSFPLINSVKQFIGNEANRNPNITWEIYNKYLKTTPEYGLSYYTYCINPTITYEIIKHMKLTNSDFRVLSRNKFKYSTDLQHVWQKRLTCAHNKLKRQELRRMLRYKIRIPKYFM